LNRNKRASRSILPIPRRVTWARELIARADVVVENFSAGVMKKYDLDYASVAPGNPDWSTARSRLWRQGRLHPTGFDPITQAEADSCRSTAS